MLASCAALLSGGPALAQQDERPSNDRPPLPVPDAPTPPDGVLDPSEASRRATGQPVLADGLRVQVRGFDFEGHTAFTTESLRSVLADLIGRALDTEDLLAARDRLTRHYVEAGYVTSGALLPDQVPRDGRIRFRLLEGRLVDVDVRGNERFKAGYLAARIEAAASIPLEVAQLEESLRRLQQDPLIERVEARLEPGRTAGESRLHLTIKEARQEDLRFVAANDRSPSVGEETGQFRARVANLIGHRDSFQVTGWFTEGLRDIEARLAIPVTRWDTRFEARARYTESEIVEFPFDPLDIESESLSISLGLYQPVLRTRSHTLELGLRGDWRRGESTLAGERFCFQPGVLDCRPTLAVIRLLGGWRWRTATQAFTFQSTLSFGTRALGATRTRNGDPGGEFVAWLGQAQYVRTTPLDGLLVTRFDLQRSDDPLLAFERMAVGGARTVRGYRPNQLVRDSGLAASAEWRVPLWKRALGPSYVDLVPFVDVGHAWNERFDGGDNTVTSLGIGLIGRPHERVEASIHWGRRLLGVDRIGNGLIDQGLHLRVSVDAW